MKKMWIFRKRKKRDKLLVTVFKRYVSFVLIIGCIYLLSYIYLGIGLTKVIDKNSIPVIDIINGKYIDYNKINVNELKKLNGEIEILDTSGNVKKRVGNISAKKKHYTEKELLNLASRKQWKNYQVFLNSVKDKNGEEYIYILRLPKDKFIFNVKLLQMPFSVGKPFYKEYGKVFLVAIGLALFCVILYSTWTARRISRPLKKIDDTLLDIINGNYDETLNLKGEEEFEVVKETLNFLITKLKKSEEENKRLEESKNKLMLDLAHDIKTPMTTIKSYSMALYEDMIDDEEKRKEYYKTLYKKSERVSELIEELFELVKLDNPKSKINLSKLDITEELRITVLEFYEEIEKEGLELIIDIPEGPIFLDLDMKLIRRGISNILENSLKYNKTATYIKVELFKTKNSVEIIIGDNGVGIPQDIKEIVFDEFVRGDKSRGTNGGTGLGLAIAKKGIEKHNGEIRLLNTIKGAVFKITLNSNE